MVVFITDHSVWISVIEGTEVVIYFVFLIFVLYMVFKFLIKLNFYREWHLTTFYIIAVMVLVLRIIQFVLLILNGFALGQTGNIILNSFDVSNTYLKVALGLVQVEKFTRITAEVRELEM
jgi:hypothetical protein